MRIKCFTNVLPKQRKCFTKMITPTITYVFDRKNQGSNKKPALVELRIIYNRKVRYISTGIKLLPKQWKNGTVTNRMDMHEIQKTLDTMMMNVRKVINDMSDAGELNTAEIKSRLSRMISDERSFIEYAAERSKVRVYGKSVDTVERYERFMKWLKRWGVIVFFSDVTDANILKMDAALVATGMKNYSKWNNYHRFLNSFILDAIDDGYLRRNPYKWLHIQKDKTKGIGKYLTPEELERIECADMPTESLERVRDLFVFQTYTCLSYTDLASFNANSADDAGEGIKVYTSVRGKTHQEFSFVILEKAREILEKYGNRLPLLSNVKYNEYLKLVAQSAKVDKPITSHWARHTGATLLLNNGVDMEVVARILGHSSTKQTRETYAKLLDDTIIREMSKFEEKMKSKKRKAHP